MSFTSIPLKEISQQILSDLKESIADPRYFTPGSPLLALAHSLGGVTYMLHAHIENVAQYQIFPDTAQGDSLKRWGDLLGIQKHQGSKSVGNILLSPEDVKSVTDKKDEESNEDRDDYTLTNENGMTFNLSKSAEAQSYICSANEIGPLSNTSPNHGKIFFKKQKSEIRILGHGINGGSDPETEEEFRERILFRLKNPFRGGTRADYIYWAKEVPFVDKVWIDIYPYAFRTKTKSNLLELIFSTTFKDHPAANEENIETVKSHLKNLVPLGVGVDVRSIKLKELSFKISVQRDEDKSLIERALTGLIARETDPGMTLTYSKILLTLAQAINGREFTVASPMTSTFFDNKLGNYEMGSFGGIEWT